MPSPLPSTINTPRVLSRIRKAAAVRFTGLRRQLVYEHGQWWAIVTDSRSTDLDWATRTYSVVDAIGGPSVLGFDFEEV